MYDFYLKHGDKLIDYKPKFENYSRAYSRKSEIVDESSAKTMRELKESNRDEFMQCLYLGIKMITHLKTNPEMSEQLLYVCGVFNGMIGLLTPREFMNIFPVSKTYDGKKYEIKDYFYTMEMINKHGIDNEIGVDNVLEFLFDYVNPTIDLYAVTIMGAIDDAYVRKGGQSVFDFLGLSTRHIENGMVVNDETGEIEGYVKNSNFKNKFLTL
jgi:hypothetical protein